MAPISVKATGPKWGVSLFFARLSGKNHMPLLSRAEMMNQLTTKWFAQNQKELEVGQIKKVTLEIIIGERSGNPVKLRSIITHESDLTEKPHR